MLYMGLPIPLALNWIVYFGFILEWRVLRLRGGGPTRTTWVRFLGKLSVVVAIISALGATLSEFPDDRIRGGAPPGPSLPGGRAVLVRFRQHVEWWPFEEVARVVQNRRPVTVVQGNQAPRQLHLEDLVVLYYETNSIQRSILVHDEDNQPVPLSDVLSMWNDFWKQSLNLRRDIHGYLQYTFLYPNDAIFQHKNPFLPPLETTIEQAMNLIHFDELLFAGFEVIHGDAMMKTTIEGLNDLHGQFDIYVMVGGRYVKLTWLQLELFYHEYPQVWAYGSWLLATPEILNHLASDPSGTNPLRPAVFASPEQHFAAGIVPDSLSIKMLHPGPISLRPAEDGIWYESEMPSDVSPGEGGIWPERGASADVLPGEGEFWYENVDSRGGIQETGQLTDMPHEPLYIMRYAHHLGFCYNGRTAEDVPCLPGFDRDQQEWSWLALRTTKSKYTLRDKQLRSRFEALLHNRLVRQRDAIDCFALKLVFQPFHLSVTAFFKHRRYLQEYGLIRNFEEYLDAVIDLHERSDFIHNMERTDLPIPIDTKGLIAKVKGFHGARPSPGCRKRFAGGRHPITGPGEILRTMDLCFNEAREPVDCPHTSDPRCAREVYIIPSGPQRRDRKSERPRGSLARETGKGALWQEGIVVAPGSVDDPSGTEPEPKIGVEAELKEGLQDDQATAEQPAPATGGLEIQSDPTRAEATASGSSPDGGAAVTKQTSASLESRARGHPVDARPEVEDSPRDGGAAVEMQTPATVEPESRALPIDSGPEVVPGDGATAVEIQTPASIESGGMPHQTDARPKVEESPQDERVVSIPATGEPRDAAETGGARLEETQDSESKLSVVTLPAPLSRESESTSRRRGAEIQDTQDYLLVMKYYHVGGNRFDASKAKEMAAETTSEVGGKETMEWGWRTLIPSKAVEGRKSGPQQKRTTMSHLYGPLKAERIALEKFIPDPKAAEHHPICTAYHGGGKGLVKLRLVADLKEYCELALALAEKTNLDVRMKEKGIKAEHSVLIKTKDVAAAIRETHGGEPLLTCKAFHPAPRDEEGLARWRNTPKTILYFVYLYFNTSRSPVDFPHDMFEDSALAECAEEIYLIPNTPIPVNHTYPELQSSAGQLGEAQTAQKPQDQPEGGTGSERSEGMSPALAAVDTVGLGTGGTKPEETASTRPAAPLPEEPEASAHPSGAKPKVEGSLPVEESSGKTPTDVQTQPPINETEKPVYLMEYIHYGGFCFNGTTDKNQQCLPSIGNLGKEWGWYRLDLVTIGKQRKEKVKSIPMKKLEASLQGELAKLKNAIEEFATDTITVSDQNRFHFILRIYSEFGRSLEAAELTRNLEDYMDVVIQLHRKTDFIRKMEGTDIKAQHSVLIDSNDVVAKVEAFHGAKPALVCRYASNVGQSILTARGDILHALDLCFDRSRRPADCPPTIRLFTPSAEIETELRSRGDLSHQIGREPQQTFGLFGSSFSLSLCACPLPGGGSVRMSHARSLAISGCSPFLFFPLSTSADVKCHSDNTGCLECRGNSTQGEMIRQIVITALIVGLSAGYNSPQSTVYDFTVKDIDGNNVTLSKYRGMVLVIVNLASECGLTDRNYKELVILQKELGFRGFRVLGFPSDQFAGQELETNEQIKTFARETYSINFDLFSKINVNGADAEPLWRFLKERQGGIIYSGIKWNFTKFLIDRNGIPVDRFSPTTPPLSMKDEIIKYLNRTAKADQPEMTNQNNTEL